MVEAAAIAAPTTGLLLRCPHGPRLTMLRARINPSTRLSSEGCWWAPFTASANQLSGFQEPRASDL